MKSVVIVRFEVTHDDPKADVIGLVRGVCEVGYEEAPVENYGATDITFEIAE